MVPHLTTSLAGPLAQLERVILDQRPEIERWFRTQWMEQEAPFYTSVDLRNSGFADRERYAEWFAMRFGYLATGGRHSRSSGRAVVRRHHGKW